MDASAPLTHPLTHLLTHPSSHTLSRIPTFTAAAAAASDVLEREEWMLVPGEDRGLGVETFGVSRKFSTGKIPSQMTR